MVSVGFGLPGLAVPGFENSSEEVVSNPAPAPQEQGPGLVGACRGFCGGCSGAVRGLSGGCKMVGRCQGTYREGVFEFPLKLGVGLNRKRVARGAGCSCLVIWAGAGRAGSGGAMRGGRGPFRFFIKANLHLSMIEHSQEDAW